MSMGAAAENDAPGPGEGKHPPSAALPNAAVAGVCVSSLLFGALAPQALHRRSSATAYSAAAAGRALGQRRRLAGAAAGPSEASTLRAGLVLAGAFAATALAALLSLIARLVAGAEGGFAGGARAGRDHARRRAGRPGRGAAGAGLPARPGGPVRDTVVATVPALFWWLAAPGFVLVSFGEAAMVVFIWVGGMAMAGHLGYCLAVHARYEQQLLAIKKVPCKLHTQEMH